MLRRNTMMLVSLSLIFALFGGLVGFLLSRREASAATNRKLKVILFSAGVGLCIGIVVWFSLFLVIAAARFVVWAIMLLLVSIVIYFFFYRPAKERAAVSTGSANQN
jgi:preprotein translocase subunit YajC